MTATYEMREPPVAECPRGISPTWMARTRCVVGPHAAARACATSSRRGFAPAATRSSHLRSIWLSALGCALLLATACAPRAPAIASKAPTQAPESVVARPSRASWATDTYSPRPATLPDPRDAEVAAACGGGIDAALDAVAEQVVRSFAATNELPEAQQLEFLQRRAGNPHVWARTFGAKVDGGVIDRQKLASDVRAAFGDAALRTRCGVASLRTGAGAQTSESLAVVSVEVVADLAAMPTRGRTGGWIDLDATLTDGVTDGRVVLLPPRGAPRAVLSSTSQGAPRHVKARFALAMPGRHVVQVLADDGHGPRPVLEAEIWADVEPSSSAPSGEVPGESAGDAVAKIDDALFARLNGLRAAEGIAKLARDPMLDGVAQAHAESMMRHGLLAHDVGEGDPRARIVAAGGGAFKILGENVARAHDERAAHRALYASPSHRGNMLDARFTKVGIGYVLDAERGEVWVAQEYGG